MRGICLVALVAACSSSSSKNNNNSCPSPFMLCGTTCTAVAVDVANCGACGNACGAGQRCVSGSCTLSCPDGITACGATCADLMTSNANCGACGKSCGGGQRCSAGACGDTCASGYTDCTGYCAATDSDSQNCGACGNVCPAGQRCASGVCSDSCAPGRTPCNGGCVDLTGDSANCGACGVACVIGETCQSGTCQCGFASLSVGFLQACGLRSDGKVVCAGAFNNSCWSAQTPDGRFVSSAGRCNLLDYAGIAVVPGLSSVIQWGSGDSFGCALLSDHTVACLGSNAFNRLGNGDSVPSPRATPVPVVVDTTPTLLSDVQQISVGANHSCALKTNGEVWCWGLDAHGELGDTGGTPHVAVSANLGSITSVTKVVAGNEHTCVLDGNKDVWCWGSNANAQCGSGLAAVSNYLTPNKVVGLSNVIDLATNFDHTCAIRNDQTVWCWGKNDHQQVTPIAGDMPSPTPAPVTGVAEVAVGLSHTCVRKTDGTLFCWGRNGHGELGNGTRDGFAGSESDPDRPSPSPVAVLDPNGMPLHASAIAVSHGHSCAIVGASNHPYCWGNNKKGQAGLTSSMSLNAQPIYSCGF